MIFYSVLYIKVVLRLFTIFYSYILTATCQGAACQRDWLEHESDTGALIMLLLMLSLRMLLSVSVIAVVFLSSNFVLTYIIIILHQCFCQCQFKISVSASSTALLVQVQSTPCVCSGLVPKQAIQGTENEAAVQRDGNAIFWRQDNSLQFHL